MKEPIDKNSEKESKLERILKYGKDLAEDFPYFLNNIYKAGPNEIKGVVGTICNHAKGRARLILRRHHIDYSCLGEHVTVFVHGLLQGAGFSLTHKRYARREGKNSILSFIYPRSLQDIRTTAMQLDDFLTKKVMTKSRAREFTLVAHSQGGLVCRYLVEKRKELNEPHAPVRRIVTLGTPFHGTKYTKHIAPFFKCWTRATDGLDQMSNEPEESEFLKRLNTKPLSVPYVSIYTIFDEIVEPAESSHLEGAVNIRLGDGEHSHIKVGHAGLLDNYEVYKIIRDAIEGKLD